MTLAQLLKYLDQHSGYAVLDGDVVRTITKAKDGNHRDPLMGEIVRLLFGGAACVDENSPISRAQATTSLGPLRLRFMKDDAPVDGFRMVERIIHAIDGAFNDEALREKYGR